MSDDTFLVIVVTVFVTIFVLTIAALREWRFMNKQHQVTVDQESRQNEEFDELIANLQEEPLDDGSQKALLEFCRRKKSYTAQAYQSALDLVSQTQGEASVKSLAIEMGRLSCGLKSRDGKPTFTDEQTIQNDIQSRC